VRVILLVFILSSVYNVKESDPQFGLNLEIHVPIESTGSDASSSATPVRGLNFRGYTMFGVCFY
jgi:hypothetical protein